MSGPPVGEEDLQLLRELSDWSSDLRGGVDSVTVIITVDSVSTQFYCQRYSTKGETALSHGLRLNIDGVTRSTKVRLSILDERGDEFPELRPCGIGRFSIEAHLDSETGTSRHELEGFIFLPSEAFRDLQTALQYPLADDAQLELSVSLPTGAARGRDEALWIERLFW